MEHKAPIIIDIEALGFASDGYPIEVGVALDDGTTFCALIMPQDDWTYWDDEAEKVHRVPRDILETHGRPIEEVAKALNDLLRDKVAYSDGWEVDKPWLSKLFWEANIPQEFRFSTLEMIMDGDQMKAWHNAKDEVREKLEKKRHRASFDAIVIQQTYLKTKR